MLNDPYHDCMSLEGAMCQFFGFKSRWYHTAGLYRNPIHVRKALSHVSSRIRTRMKDIATLDVRLEAAVASILNQLDEDIEKIGKYHNQLEIIADLLTLVAYLLGYGRMTGKPIRQVVYFQTAEQVLIDEDLARGENPRAALTFELAKRAEVVHLLQRQGLRVAQIARVMRLPEHQVRDYLRSGGPTEDSSV